jgi:LPXTG-site transpeptidase (sortase) family protein
VAPLGVLAGLLAALVTVAAVLLVTAKDSRPSPVLGPRLTQDQVSGGRIRPEPVQTGKTTTSAGGGSSSSTTTTVIARQQPRPTRIRIPAIGVSTSVISLGLNGDRTMQTPRNFAQTGWYKPGPEPGEPGASVIAGHVDSTTGPAVFYELGHLKRGDLIYITRINGTVIKFRVQGLEVWAKAQFPTKRVFKRGGPPLLRLITCSGAFDHASGHYVDNTIVYAVPVG